MALYQWSTTAATNATAGSINWAEGQAPSTVNDSARQLMADVATYMIDPQFYNHGDTPTYVSTSSFTVTGNQTAPYAAHRRIKCTVTAGTVYGTISSSSFSTVTTVNVTLDSGALDSGLSKVELGIITGTSNALPDNLTASSATTATNIAGGAAGSLPYQSGAGATALLAAGTNGYVLTLAAGLPSWSAAPFSTTYTSPTPAALSTAIIAENHGLGAIPSLVQATFRCATAEAGYSIGDELKVDSVDAVGYVTYNTWANATQVGFTCNGTINIRVANKSTGVVTTLTAANWTVVLRAWK